MSQNYGLGRGLASLIPQKKSGAQPEEKKINTPRENYNYFGADSRDSGKENQNSNQNKSPGNSIQEVNIEEIVPNPHQPRIIFDEDKIKELSDSIKNHGLIQPLVVTKNGRQFELIAGERRLQAAKLAGLKKIPIIVREAGEQEKLELAIVENIHRHDLNPIEEGKAYQKLISEFELSQEEVSVKVGKSRSGVANKIRLLNLQVEAQKALMNGQITEGHAKAILAIENPEKQRALFELILKSNLTVRQTEDKTKEISVRTHKRTMHIDPEVKAIEEKLLEALGTKVKVSRFGSGGKIVIDYYSQEELDNILSRIVN
ncbi:MAG: chromosome partitioning protein ParB [Candidatus Moranbacteria bacterium CG10_big_fil_rev_8_21_14_0_10_35_21]|nr:MAG: chromosome partitioning protein ParB [Candidatus Moranbacteria bacterium CG10_big_fil_rev_8_21_14_0_10_35_21]PJA88905.1 MAG: chromosome partitioning protein ParB [Candidatus Moranbacteria bacterium CG_4_9_14_3_um_filter_36_9]